MSQMDEVLRVVLETNERLAKTLAAMNDISRAPVLPGAAAGVGDQIQSGIPVGSARWMDPGDIQAVRAELRKKTMSELLSIFNYQARKEGTGIPFGLWAGGAAQGAIWNGIQGSVDPDVKRVLDTGGAAALIRQDLEPVLYELYVRQFPAYERFPKEPANGLVHTWNQITSFGGAKFMSELGTVTDDGNVYARKTTNIAIAATRRGVSLKSQFAVVAGGMGYNPEQQELNGGLRAIAKTVQDAIFGGQATDSGGTADNELGLYDANGFDGLRSILNQTQAVNADPLAGTPDDLRQKYDDAATKVMNNGGRVSIIWNNPLEKNSFDYQQDKNVRYMNSFVDVAPGVLTNAVNTIFGPLPLAVVPGGSIGAYTDGGGTKRRDVYLLDEENVTLPYLGTDGPTVLDIPIGISGQLTHLFIIFVMNGLAVKALPFNNKVRVKVA